MPSKVSSSLPSTNPIPVPSAAPSTNKAAVPSALPSVAPSLAPTVVPSAIQSVVPSTALSSLPSINPSTLPSAIPSVAPSLAPTPSTVPSKIPSEIPSTVPSTMQSLARSASPSAMPSTLPSATVGCTAPNNLVSASIQQGDEFGYSTAIFKNTIVVGSWLDDDYGTDSGSAYIFSFSGTFIAKIFAPDGVSGDLFGVSVAVSEDRIVVGANENDQNGSSSGSAYVFEISGTFVTKLLAPDGQAGDWFGLSVSISDSTIVVGAPSSNIGVFISGSAYIFNTSGTFIAKLIPSDLADHDYFGFSVDISGSIIVIGSREDDDNGTDSGSAYLFSTSGVIIMKLLPSDGVASDWFGWSVAITDDTIVIGAPTATGTGPGSAYIFNTSGTEICKLTAPDGVAGDFFGIRVALSRSKIVVGADQNANLGITSGAAYVFETSGPFVQKLVQSNCASGDQFGFSVSISDSTIVIGARQHSFDEGAAYTFCV